MLIRNAEALERFATIDALIIDKTGTLTEGGPSLTDVTAFGDMPEDRVLALAAALERGSEHPTAEAVLRAAQERNIERLETTRFEAVTGMGVKGQVSDASVGIR